MPVDALVLVLVFLFAVAVCVLHVLWALRVMRAVESIARTHEGASPHLGTMATAVVAIGRHIRGEPDPAPARPRHSPKI